MHQNVSSISSSSCNIRQDVYPLEQWSVKTRKGIIMQSRCTCSKHGASSEDSSSVTNRDLCPICLCYKMLPQLASMPDMLFHDNVLRLEHYTGIGIEFNPMDALKCVEEVKDPLRVAVADGWQSARADFPFAKSVVKPFDWTFTTSYRGTLLEAKRLRLIVEETQERIDVNKLRAREEILFYDDITLYEDELADHGIAQYSVKVRVMPKCLFVLARFYLRVDGVLARINDTRVYHELNKQFLLREYTNREAKLSSLNLPLSVLVDPNELMQHLPIIQSSYEKLVIPK